jgi:hypothetical protein
MAFQVAPAGPRFLFCLLHWGTGIGLPRRASGWEGTQGAPDGSLVPLGSISLSILTRNGAWVRTQKG